MIDRESDDYKIAVNELGHTVALAIDKFKKLVGYRQVQEACRVR